MTIYQVIFETPSGRNEIIGTFNTIQEARDFRNSQVGTRRRWSTVVEVQS